jgi:TrkA domain protein
MGITERDLPGIGRRYDVEAADGGRLTVVVHHSGRRDVYVTPPGGDTPAVVSFGDDQSRRLGAILGGAYFRPAAVEAIEAVIGGLLIDWVTLGADSPAVGRSIADLEVRRRTRMTIAAVLRGDDATVAPEPSEVLRAGDRLVVLGRPEDLPGFLRVVVG